MTDHIKGIGGGKGVERIDIIIQQGDTFFNMLALLGSGVDSYAAGTETAVMQGANDEIQLPAGLLQSQGDSVRIDLTVSYLNAQTDFQLRAKQMPGVMALGDGIGPVPGVGQGGALDRKSVV